MTKYKVGDTVIIRKDLVKGNANSIWKTYTNDSMVAMSGMTFTINEVTIQGRYHFKEERNYIWEESMFESVEVVEEIKIKKPKVLPEIEIIDNKFNVRLHIHKAIYCEPATIIYYEGLSGEINKSVAKCNENDVYDKELGLKIAIHKAIVKEAKRELVRLSKQSVLKSSLTTSV